MLVPKTIERQQLYQLKKLIVVERGQGIVEYGLIIFMVAIMSIVALLTLSPPINGYLEKVAVKLN